ncbi:hypothetical protein LCGC14_1257850 [marine sediment metagenome]|uniref:Uncharacterized protein n=1 Tax=marine sediment metagenome TaxID=412755 RepID=A0A0F9LMV6_9ZZZZ
MCDQCKKKCDLDCRNCKIDCTDKREIFAYSGGLFLQGVVESSVKELINDRPKPKRA